MRTGAAIVLCLVLATPVYGGDGPVKPGDPPVPAPTAPPPAAGQPKTPEQVADAVRAAVESKAGAALASLAAMDAPDPWLVADALLARSSLETALAFAKAAPRGDVAQLPAYLAAHPERPEDATPRARLVEVNAALARKDFATVLAMPSSDGPLETVTAIRHRSARGLALRGLHREIEAATPLGEAADAAERVGWLARAAFALHLVGLDAFVRGDRAAASAAWTRRASLEERRGVPTGEALAASSLGSLHAAFGEWDRAVEWKERAIRIYDQAGEVVAASADRTELADVHRRAGRLPQARELLEQALSALEPAGPTPTRMAAHVALARLSWEAGQSTAAIDASRSALADAEALGDRQAQALAHGNLGSALVSMGRFEEGEREHELSRSLHEALGDHANGARAMANRANVWAMQGRYGEALTGLNAARRIAEEGDAAHESEAREARAQIHGMLAIVHLQVGSLEEALLNDRAALALLDPVRDRHQRAHVICHVGQIQWQRGEMSHALESFDEAAAIYRSVGNASGVAAALTNLGIVRHVVGDFAGAQTLYEQALELQRDIGDLRGQATLMNNLGATYAAAGRDDESLATHEQALALRSTLGDPAALAWTRANLATLQVRHGEVARGLAGAEQALGEFTALRHRAGAAFAMLCRAEAQAAAGDRAAALSTLDAAVAETEAMGLREHLVRALSTRADLRLAGGDPAGARDDAHRALATADVLVSGLADEQGSSARSGHVKLYATGAAAAARLGDPSEVLYFLENGRAGALLEALKGRESLRSTALPDALLVAEAEARAQETAAVGAWSGLDTEDGQVIRAARRRMVAAQEGVREVVGRIQREAKKAAQILYPTADGLAAIRGRLEKDQALVLYGLSDEEPLALVVTANGATFSKLPPTEDVEAACHALLAEIRDRTSPEAASAAADALRDLVVKPLALSPETKRLLISPDRALSYVPFALLAPDREVVCIPSATTYGILLEDGKARGDGVLALGDPVYQGPADERGTGAHAGPTVERLVRLPATALEARAVGDTLLLGKDATERGLRTAVATNPRWRAVHFACHGLIDDSRPAVFSSLALTAGDEDDGFLTMLEVFRARIPADLVVLSACETGKGEFVRGEGILGLTRAFMYAGAPRVICSLWKVNDEATRALMTKFYELWNPRLPASGSGTPGGRTGPGAPGLPAAEALRRAQAFVRSQERWQHPYYWAAWVLWGLPD